MTAMDYFARYVYNADYTQATEIGIDRIMTGGNALENLADAYPGWTGPPSSWCSSRRTTCGIWWASSMGSGPFNGGAVPNFLIGRDRKR